MSANTNSPQMSAYACQQLANAQNAQQGVPSAASIGLINRQQAQAAQALGIEPQHAHLTNLDCYAKGCKTCNLSPPVAVTLKVTPGKKTGQVRVYEYTGPEPKPYAPGATLSDAQGRLARASVSDAIAGCRLGCACKVHRPAKAAPYVPTIDDWDLLPDV